MSESIINEVPDDNYDLSYHQNDNGEAVMIKIDVPVPLREEARFPKEKWKTFIAFVVLASNMILATVSLSLVHERLPDRETYGPLPDVFLDNVTPLDFALDEVPDDNYDLSYHQNDNGEAVMIKIDVPVPLREEARFPKEKWKTFIAFVVLASNMILATVSLSLVHERLPDRETYGPLPDVFLDNVTPLDFALDVSEILIMIQVNSCIILITFHKHRFIVMRRIFLMMSILYFLRSITMYVTVLPVSSTTYFCSPKLSNSTTPLIIAKRAFQLMSGFGLSINGKHTFCGDYIYSGHTVMLVLGYLTISEYLPKRLYVLHWIAWINALVGVIMVLVAHGHYTIDVLIAYYITTRLFWVYHTLANNSFLMKQAGPNNYLSREWWFTYYKYFERNVRGQVPNQYEWPLPWPRRFVTKIPNRES